MERCQARQILGLFCVLIALILGQNCVKGLRVTKTFKEIQFEEVRDQLEAKKCFRRQSFTKYLRLTLVFMRTSALNEKFISVFQEDLLVLI